MISLRSCIFLAASFLLGINQSISAIASIYFVNKTDKVISAIVQYEAFNSTTCHDEKPLSAPPGKTVHLDRSYKSGRLKGWVCSVGNIYITTDDKSVTPVEVSSRRFPSSTGDATITVTQQNNVLQASITSGQP